MSFINQIFFHNSLLFFTSLSRWHRNIQYFAFQNAMNESQCSDIESVKWTDVGNLISLAILAFIIVLVIVGNCLVIAAVFCSHKLRSVTNFFIVSLAVADLLVGIAVLPFSATWEVFKVSFIVFFFIVYLSKYFIVFFCFIYFIYDYQRIIVFCVL